MIPCLQGFIDQAVLWGYSWDWCAEWASTSGGSTDGRWKESNARCDFFFQVHLYPLKMNMLEPKRAITQIYKGKIIFQPNLQGIFMDSPEIQFADSLRKALRHDSLEASHDWFPGKFLPDTPKKCHDKKFDTFLKAVNEAVYWIWI